MPNQITDAALTGGQYPAPDEVAPWITCTVCGQRVDTRQGEAMIHHAASGHSPMAEVEKAPAQSETNGFVDAFAHPAGPADVTNDPPSALPRHI